VAAPLCEICGEKPATHRCPLCGRWVCDDDWDEERGVCTLCATTLCQVCGKRLAVASCPACGRLVCDECSVQVTPVVRLCIDCYRRYGGAWPPRRRAEREVLELARSLRQILLHVPRR
jgi:hypothetical protein